jgi:hypothetical protein
MGMLGGAVKAWYLSGGTSIPKAAFKATGAASYAASKVNLVNPGTLDLIDGVIPPVEWTAGNGWRFGFNNNGGYLRTGITSANGDVTILIRFTTGIASTNSQVYFGLYDTGILYIQNEKGVALHLASDASTINTTELANGSTHTLVIAGENAYLDGNVLAGTLTKNAITNELFIGALNLVGTGSIQCCEAQITHFAYWDKVITADNIKAITNAINPVCNWSALQTAYINQKLGVMIDWAMFTNMPWTGGTPPPITDFAPTDMDVDQWLDAAASAGAKYAVMTANGLAGFSIWPTAFHVGTNPPYSIAQTAFYSSHGSPDPLALFVAGCRTRSINPCFYYRLINENYQTQSGYTMVTNPAAYMAMFEAQLTELLTNYGDIGAIWVDGWDPIPGGINISYNTINAFIKAIQPNCLLINNSHVFPMTHTEIETHENDYTWTLADTTYPKEYTEPIYNNSIWYYDPQYDQTATGLFTAAAINSKINYVNDRGATYLLAIAPGYDGHLPAAQVTVLGQIHT